LNGSPVRGRSRPAGARIATSSGAPTGGKEGGPWVRGKSGHAPSGRSISIPRRPHLSPAWPLGVLAPLPAAPRPAPRRPRPGPPRSSPSPPAPAAPGARSAGLGTGDPAAGPQHGALPRGPAVHQVPAARLQLALLGLYVLVGAGALMMAVGFFGCCGAMRESQCVLGSAIRHVQTMYEEAYNDYLKDRGKGNGTLITFHSTFQCCGKESSEQVQPTCPKELLGHKNCIDEIETIISVKLQLIGIVGIGIAGLTIFGMIFSMVLCCAIRNSRDVI
uniref:Tetraspanin-2 n=1 Tax=Macaca mulatta TaxID=9544 RepID=A0A5F7ZGR0_MACMU